LQRTTLRFAAAVEALTGLGLLVDPALVVRLLLGVEIDGAAVILARCFGIGLIALAAPPSFGMLVYNAGIALYLGYVGAIGLAVGWLLWPAVALHAVVAVILAWTRGTRHTPAGRLID
jgi:hypothetical protein